VGKFHSGEIGMFFKEKEVMKTRLWKIIFVILLCGFLPAATVRAEWITIAISGQVYDVIDPHNLFGGQIQIGGTISGTYTYNSATPDLYPSDTTVGEYRYYSSPAGTSLNVGGFNFRTNPTNVDFRVVIQDTPPIDRYTVISYYNLLLPDGIQVEAIDWQLYDQTGTALSSDTLPLTAPDLSKWQPWQPWWGGLG
jgi:hypothetical protein